MRRSWRVVAITLFLGALLVGGLAGPRLLALSSQTREGLRLYTELIEKSHDAYGGEVTYRELVYASIQGMLRTLDPHTSFLSPEAYGSMRDRQKESFFGLGILVGIRDGKLTVITPIEGGPAAKLGMRPGDVIYRIEGETTDSMTINDAVRLLKGPKDTVVNITIVRRGFSEPFDLAVTRGQVAQETIQYAYMVAPDTGYLMLREFQRSTGREVADTLADLKEQGMQRLILDLRTNGGGLLDQAIEVADQFVPQGTKIVEVRGRVASADTAYYSSSKYGEPLGLPVVVLVSGGTASAAEIVSGAIQDHDVGIILGEPTWGKGLVQTVYTLPYGSGMALTTAKYYTPSGRLIQRDYTSYWDYYTQYDPDADPAVAADGSPAFQTDLGRKVYGGGGITPDVHSDPDLVPMFVQFLRGHAAFFKFAVDHNARQPPADESFVPGPEVFETFKKWLLEEELVTEEQITEGFSDEEIVEQAKIQMHYEIANVAFGVTAGNRVRSQSDSQIQEAFLLFDKAQKMLETRKALESASEGGGQVAGR
jgi:carboxyl-terminal processing protease